MPRDSKKKGGLGRGVLSLLPQDEQRTASAATANIDEAAKRELLNYR